ncbi:MAG: hypothetical protein JSV49_00820 [Thermoplasmata archaeon]|nr:MAG: hypothetical protein JSV49_00820 [Thermoplasmata archaeon]
MQSRDPYQSEIFFLGVQEIDAEPLQEINENLIRLEELSERNHPEFVIASLSVRWGKKFYLSTGEVVNTPVNPNDFVEIVDYDPVRNSALAVGKTGPNEDMPFHWFSYRTFPHINGIAVVKLLVDIDIDKFVDIKSIDSEIKLFQPDIILNILPHMKEGSSINLLGKGIAFYNNSFKDLFSELIQFFKNLESHLPKEESEQKGADK